MSETTHSEINVDRVMYEIREAVARQKRNLGKEVYPSSTEYSLVGESKPHEQNGFSPLILQPEFQARADNRYHVNDLLKYHGADFVRNAYRALLRREPDPKGWSSYLENLASGRLNKIDVLASLHFSPEGQSAQVKLTGLRLPTAIRRLERLPLIGYLVQLMGALARLPLILRHPRQSEVYLVGQQQRIVDHSNQVSGQFEAALAQLRIRSVAGAEKAQPLSPVKAVEGDHFLDALYASFEDQFRGDREEIKERLRVYLPILKDAKVVEGVLDLGNGRGEWLEILKSEGVGGRGVDNNRVFVDRCRQSGLDVAEADAIDYLRRVPNQSVSAVTVFHLVEHLEFEVLVKLLDEIVRALKPGGLLILETPNPENFIIGSCNFYVDPTHRNPIPPITLQFLLESRGLSRVEILRLPRKDVVKLEGDSQAVEWINEHFAGPPDYGIIGRKA